VHLPVDGISGRRCQWQRKAARNYRSRAVGANKVRRERQGRQGGGDKRSASPPCIFPLKQKVLLTEQAIYVKIYINKLPGALTC